jgi:Anti-sigma factor NepR
MGEQMAIDRPSSRRHNMIDENLRRVYDEALNEEIPDRFKELLAQLKQRDASLGKDGAERTGVPAELKKPDGLK